MTVLLDWISQHQQAIAMLGTGAATALTGIWAVVRYLSDRNGAKDGSEGGEQSTSTFKNKGNIVYIGKQGDGDTPGPTTIRQNSNPALVLLAAAVLVGTVLAFFVPVAQKLAERPTLLSIPAQPPPRSTTDSTDSLSQTTIEDSRQNPPRGQFELRGEIIEEQ